MSEISNANADAQPSVADGSHVTYDNITSYDTSDDLPDNNSISVVGDDATDELPGFIYSSLAGDDQEELDSVRDDVNIHSSRNGDLNTSQDDL